jgi:AcrR family transcriptional regulator
MKVQVKGLRDKIVASGTKLFQLIQMASVSCYSRRMTTARTAPAKDPQRRAAWAELATDYVHEHGLIGLSLRPLAAELGTSNRVLLYHFGTKDQLVADVLRTSNGRSVAEVAALEPSKDLRSAVHDLWAVMEGDRCSWIYVEAAALGLLGREPYASAVRDANTLWIAALIAHLDKSGMDPVVAERAAHVIDAAFMGFQLSQSPDGNLPERARSVDDLADAVAALA